MPDGATLLIGATDGTRVFLWLQPLDGPARKLDLGEINPSWSNWVDVTVGRNGSIAFSGAEPKRPTELYYLSSPTAKVRRLTDFNHDIAALELGTTETISWRTADGMTADGVLTYPPDYVKGKRYPLLVRHPRRPQPHLDDRVLRFRAGHGGARLPRVPTRITAAATTSATPTSTRSSTMRAKGRRSDIVGGIQVVQAMGVIDDSKIAVGGLSYGGFMTAWLVGHYSIFKADVMAGAAARRAGAIRSRRLQCGGVVLLQGLAVGATGAHGRVSRAVADHATRARSRRRRSSSRTPATSACRSPNHTRCSMRCATTACR